MITYDGVVNRILQAIKDEDALARQPGYTCPTECMETNHPGREHLDWWEDRG